MGQGLTSGANAAAPFLMANHQAKLEEKRLMMLEKMRATQAQADREFRAQQADEDRAIRMDGLNLQRDRLAFDEDRAAKADASAADANEIQRGYLDLAKEKFGLEKEAAEAQLAQISNMAQSEGWSVKDYTTTFKTVVEAYTSPAGGFKQNPDTGKPYTIDDLGAITRNLLASTFGGGAQDDPYGGAVRKLNANRKPQRISVMNELSGGLMGR